MDEPNYDVKKYAVLAFEVNVRVGGELPTQEFKNLVFDKLAAAAERALKPLGIRINGISWDVLDPQFWLDQAIPETSHRTVISLTTEQLEYFSGKRLSEESLPDAIDRIVALAFKEDADHPFSITKPQLKHELKRLCATGWITEEQLVKVLTTLGYTKKETEEKEKK